MVIYHSSLKLLKGIFPMFGGFPSGKYENGLSPQEPNTQSLKANAIVHIVTIPKFEVDDVLMVML